MERDRIEQQIDLFSDSMPKYVVDKPVRLIEFFAGIGSQYKALKQLTNNVESYKICEWAYNSIVAYNAIHIKDRKDYSNGLNKDDLLKYLNGNISIDYNTPADLTKKSEEWLRNCYNHCKATHNLMNIMNVHAQDLEVRERESYCYVLTYSFPCQDLSLSNKNRAGMSVSQANGGTRSGLLWEVERILDELKTRDELPHILLMENVPQVIGSIAIKDFQKWRYKLEELGYTNYCEILNSKDYGIPQNRQRCFMISILGEYSYDFPIRIPLQYRLKDFLEKSVDEKYYLSQDTIDRIKKWNSYENPLERVLGKQSVSPTITTRIAESCDGGMSASMKVLSEDLNDTTDIRKDTDRIIKVGNYGNGHHAKDISDENGIMPTICCGNHGTGQNSLTSSPNTAKENDGGGN